MTFPRLNSFRTLLTLAGLALVASLAAVSQTPKQHRHQLVFEMNSPGPEAWQQMINNINAVKKSFAPEDVQIEVVAFGKGLSILLKTNTAFEEQLKKIAGEGVVLDACQTSMRSRKVTTEDLFPFTSQVDSGAAEVIRKQEAGWSYMKSGE